MKRLKNISTFFLLTAFLSVSLFFTPRKVNALFVDIPQLIKEYGIDTLITTIGARMVDKISESTLRWANGGFDGAPSFISNWDEFLKGIAEDAYRMALDHAMQVATVQLGNLSQSLSNEKARKALECIQAGEKKFKQLEGREIVDNCTKKVTKTSADGLNIKTYEVLEVDQDCANRIKRKYDRKRAFQRDFCTNKYGAQAGLVNGLYHAAKQNYELYRSGTGFDARQTALTIAKYAAKDLNVDALKEAIERKGPLATYLGSRARVGEFQSDFSKGGWFAYIESANDNPLVNQSRILSLLKKKKDEAEKKKIDQQQTENKILDKVKCGKGGKNEYGECKNPEESVITSSNQDIAARKEKAATKDQDQALLADELSDLFSYALNKFTRTALKVGINYISQKIRGNDKGNDFVEKMKDFVPTEDDSILGAVDDMADTAGSNDVGMQNISGNSDAALNQAMSAFTVSLEDVPYIGGPEDETDDPFGGPQRIINLRKSLDPAIKNLKKLIDIQTSMRILMFNSAKYVADLDHCLPGPDYGWEKRFKKAMDKMRDIYDGDSEGAREMRMKCDLAEKNLKALVNDPLFNIPGSLVMRSVISQMMSDDVLKEYSSIYSSSNKTRVTYSLLLRAKDGVENEFAREKELLNLPSEIPLFEDEIKEKDLTEILQKFEKIEEKLKKIKEYNPQRTQRDSSQNTNTNNDTNTNDNNAASDEGVMDNVEKNKRIEESIISELNSIPVKPTYKQKIDDATLISILSLPPIDEAKTKQVIQRIGIEFGLTMKDMPELYGQENVKEGGSVQTQQGGTGASVTTVNTLSPQSYLLEQLDLYYFKKGETPEELVRKNREKAEQLALDLGWALWRKYTPRKLKSFARYQYDSVKFNIPMDEDVKKADSKYRSFVSLQTKMIDYVHDCHTFVMKLGKKSDREIKSILEQEYQRQKDKKRSMFKTDLFTSPTNIETSILSFIGKENEKDKYLKMYYETRPRMSKPESVKRIFELDQTLRTMAGVSPIVLRVNREAIKWSAGLGIFGAIKSLLTRKTYITFEVNPDIGKDLFCIAPFSHTFLDACISPFRHWYYSNYAVYKAKIKGI